jgi:hypothetical protein
MPSNSNLRYNGWKNIDSVIKAMKYRKKARAEVKKKLTTHFTDALGLKLLKNLNFGGARAVKFCAKAGIKRSSEPKNPCFFGTFQRNGEKI